ncbi:hypothetical protein, partial [Actinoplanes sp. NBRC 103695]|uniref:hypothetical protein n=1 Tax=Actinoplanes sp. NBRC 103695 TaxID=3032202 RepID=UPI002557330A
MTDVPDTVAGQVVRVDDSVRRLLPVLTVDQRRALRTLSADTGLAGPGKVERFLGLEPPGLTGEPDPVADHSAQLGVPYAALGDGPGRPLAAVLGSSGRVSLAGLRDAVGGEFTQVAPSVVANQLESGDALVAAVHGWPPGATQPQMVWLYRGSDGKPHWAVEGTPELSPDGSGDPRTRLLEQPHTTVALLGPGWRVIDPPPRAVVFEPSSSSLFVSVRSRASG